MTIEVPHQLQETEWSDLLVNNNPWTVVALYGYSENSSLHIAVEGISLLSGGVYDILYLTSIGRGLIE